METLTVDQKIQETKEAYVALSQLREAYLQVEESMTVIYTKLLELIELRSKAGNLDELFLKPDKKIVSRNISVVRKKKARTTNSNRQATN
jgi:hypothetical protein